MTRKRRERLRVVDEDGLDRVVAIDQNTPVDAYPAWMRERGVGGFEHMLRDAMAMSNAIIAAQPPLPPRLINSLRPEAYARRILANIQRLRTVVHTAPQQEGTILAAIRLGYDLADAAWRFGRGNLTRTGVRRRTQSRHAGRDSGIARRTYDPDELKQRALQIRQTHPYHRQQYSTRELAKTLAAEFRLSLNTVRGVLRAQRIR